MPDLPPPDVRRVQAQSDIAAREGDDLLARGDVNTAIKKYERALLLCGNPLAYRGLGNAYLATGNYQKSVENFRTLLYPSAGKTWITSAELEPEVLMSFALALVKVGQYEEAIKSYQRGLGFLHRTAQGESNLPIPLPDLNEALKRQNPKRLEALARIGIGLSGNGIVDPTPEQLAHLKEATRVDPGLSLAHYYYGNALSRLPHTQISLSSLEQAETKLSKAAQFGNLTTRNEAEKVLASVKQKRAFLRPVAP